MKVPILYKSSDRYNAGVDVVYNDGSKLQYPPFVYATTASGDNGGDEDEEGDEVMTVNLTANEQLGVLIGDVKYSDIETAFKAGKNINFSIGDGEKIGRVVSIATQMLFLYVMEDGVKVLYQTDDNGYPYTEIGG